MYIYFVAFYCLYLKVIVCRYTRYILLWQSFRFGMPGSSSVLMIFDMIKMKIQAYTDRKLCNDKKYTCMVYPRAITYIVYCNANLHGTCLYLPLYVLFHSNSVIILYSWMLQIRSFELRVLSRHFYL